MEGTMMIWLAAIMRDSQESNIITTNLNPKVSNRANIASCLEDPTTTPASAGTATTMKKMKLMKKWAHLAGIICIISQYNNKKERASSPATTAIGSRSRIMVALR